MSFAPTAAAAAHPLPQSLRVDHWRELLRGGRARLRDEFCTTGDTPRLLKSLASLTDEVVVGAWGESGCRGHCTLIAVGGYGRGQLYPHSDVDVLILLPARSDVVAANGIERLLASLWDIGVELSHAVRTVAECVSEMASDTTICTSLLEHRRLAGSRRLYDEFRRQFARALDVRSFYAAKLLEQQQRHLKFHDAAYNLEPNVKESPGGLRDLQTVIWIARAAGLGRSWRELAKNRLMTAAEARAVSRQERTIGELRARLHYLAGRREDRLVFDLQSALAREFALVDKPARRASEQLMQRYYRATKVVRQVNTLLLQNLHARLYPAATAPLPIDAEFQRVDELLDVRDESLFERRPGAMFDASLALQRHPELRGMTARTLRALWRNRHRIDAAFRREPAHRAQFLQMFREPRGLTHELRRMNLYGVLGQYLPAFGRIVGQMQHDLFHVYTVDEHILMVIRNLRRFTEAQHAHEYPLCSRLITDFERKEVLYLAGLFHDVAKGRGGDHSVLGAREARRFCRQHGLPGDDTELVAWLVAEHLTMSSTAQKQDITNPEVIDAFAKKVGDERALSALYLLTVADIRGTSPSVWNAWKAKLLEDLFHATKSVLAGGAAQRTIADSIELRQREARRLLRLYAVPEGAEQRLWRELDITYFQRHTADEIAWHARHLHWRVGQTAPVVKVRLAKDGAGLQALVYLPDQKSLFARICGFFGRAGLSILDAKVHTTRDGYALDTFAVHDPANPAASYRETIQYIEFELAQALASPAPLTPPEAGRISRQLRHFPLTPEVQISPDDKGTHFILEIVAGDRPGLLARIAYALAQADIDVVSARINTLGERAEDVFLISGAKLHDEQAVLRLETALYEQLRV
ncbi:MAG: [protein-PII] uridylyltransferase [Betaproteobacteria bacterium]|nr:[protein-PII] uridylyltransferase [Betaproteobacteria bacterium]MDE2210283.1 [protein-PII] uridylyltransferase [Betaproteobacteria bacterium]